MERSSLPCRVQGVNRAVLFPPAGARPGLPLRWRHARMIERRIVECDRERPASWNASRMFALALTLCLNSVTQAMQPDGLDSAVAAILFSFREAAQLHTTAHALAMAAINKAPSKEVVEHCDRAIESFENMSVPLFRRYADKCSTDAELAAAAEGVLDLQQASLDELRAVKAMAESGNAAKQRFAFLGSVTRYNETATRVAALIIPQADTAAPRRTAEPRHTEEHPGSPNAQIFSDEAWGDVVEEMRRRGVVRTSTDASRYFRTFSLLKSVFVASSIEDPSPKQLFGLAELLNFSFAQMTPEKIETTLATMLRLAKDTGQEVASKDVLMRLGK